MLDDFAVTVVSREEIENLAVTAVSREETEKSADER